MSIKLQPITDNECESIFFVVKRAIFEHVDVVSDWDEDFQIYRLKIDYASNWFYWLCDSNQRIGLV
ncbi:hypothetical protein [Photobacterium profundum]|uniref:hypothetical protein n=1 Tax=Photobacterium profundum TaxID=74109 RepID=UPI003D0B6B00